TICRSHHWPRRRSAGGGAHVRSPQPDPRTRHPRLLPTATAELRHIRQPPRPLTDRLSGLTETAAARSRHLAGELTGATSELDLEVDTPPRHRRRLPGEQLGGPHPPRGIRRRRFVGTIALGYTGRAYRVRRRLLSGVRDPATGVLTGHLTLTPARVLAVGLVGGRAHGVLASLPVSSMVCLSGRCAGVNQRPTVDGCTPRRRAMRLFGHPCPRSPAATSRRSRTPGRSTSAWVSSS